MDPRDRLFGEIAVRLQLLTREQLAECIREQEAGSSKRLGELAVEAGHIDAGEAELIASHQQRILDKRRLARMQPARAEAAALVEEQAQRSDPRSASGSFAPPPAGAGNAVSSGAGAGDASPPVALEDAAPSEALTGLERRNGTVMGGLAGAAISRKRLNDKWATGVSQGAVPIAAATAVAEVTPPAAPAPPPPVAELTPPAAPAPPAPPPAEDLEAFPIAEEDEVADVGDLAVAPPARPAPPTPPPAAVDAATAEPPSATFARGGTVLGMAAVQPAAPLVAPAPPPPPPAAAGATVAQQHRAVEAAVQQAPPPPSVPAPKAPAARPRAMTSNATQSYLGRALSVAMRQGASDLHVHSGAPLMVRIDGQLRPLSDATPLTAEAAEQVIAEVMTDAQWAELSRAGEVDFAYAIDGLGRFRVNVYRQQRGFDVVFRIIAAAPPALEELGLPARLSRLTDFRTGMVLCTGPAGCGKSTTLAALVNLLVQRRAEHVLTIENPVEHVYPPGRALVNQREVGAHTGSFARALRAALREDPDIIVITELRDRETMSLAISAAETGHLVLGTLHTGNAGQTISRIVSAFPADEQDQVRVMLAESLRAVLSQRLLPAAAGRGRVPAIELLMVNTAVSKLIRDDKTFQLPSAMQTGKAAGMMTLDDSIAELVSGGLVTPEVARRFARKKERFQ